MLDNTEKSNVTFQSNVFDSEENTGFAIVINGHSLVHCLTPEMEDKFLDIAAQCKAVICCRVTPLQKALVVDLIKRTKNAVTLAIGDGANDVSMIKTAHVGVGISGQEGMQAVLASDYSIAQFKYLERLLLVHGRWSYYRMSKFLRYFFYKNFAFTLCHYWFAFFCGFSAQTVFDPMFISVYNLFYTALPVLALGIFEQDVSDKMSVEYPKLYTPGLTNALFNTTEFIRSVLHGVFSSLILFLIPYGSYKDGISPEGYVLSDHMLLGSVVATILILDNTAQIALDTSYWTVFNHIMIWGSLVWYFVLDYFYNYVIGGPYVGSLTKAMEEVTFWFTTVITVIVLMLPILAFRFYVFDCNPSLADRIRMKQRMTRLSSRASRDVLRTPSARRQRRSLRSGYAFAHQEGFGRLITSGKIMRKLPQEFAFPLGLGGKKQQSVESHNSGKDQKNQSNTITKLNNNNSNHHINNTSDNDISTTDLPGSSNSDSRTTHMTTDTMATGLIFHAASQVEILGSRISKIGYFAGQEELQDKMTPKLKMYLNKKFYNDLIAQIKHHKEIIEFCKEIQDAFKEALFVQLITTCFILCMTELQMVVLLQQSLILFANSLPYFIILALQIYLLCYCGNELTYAVTFFYCVTE
uniref:P-type phospholipid transporter n=1 Tax=Culicoides sonorensis TaxID=179676 RepID=A0A336MRN3_CULSO